MAATTSVLYGGIMKIRPTDITTLSPSNSSINTSVDESNHGNDVITMYYDAKDIFRLSMETCQNMVKIATDANGEPLVDEYAMDEDTPTPLLKQQMVDNTMSDIMQLMSYLVPDDYGETAGADGDNPYYNATLHFTNGQLSDSKKLAITLKYDETFKDAQMKFMYDATKGMLVYGILAEWFTTVNHDALRGQSLAEYTRKRNTLLKAIKPLLRKLKISYIKNL